MNTQQSNQFTAILLAVLMVTSVFAGTVAFSGTAAAAPGDVLYRANAGGTVTASDGVDWVDDAQYLVTGNSQTANNPAPSSIDDSVPSGTPSGIWTTERYDPPEQSEMGYEFDVPAGQRVLVRLYFYDGYSGTSAPGERVFDVSVEDQSVENFDPIAAYGDQTGGVEMFEVTSDGTIDVDFAHAIENPQINAIEIVEATPEPGVLSAPGEVSFGTAIVGQSETQTVTLSNAGGSGDVDITVDDVSVTGADAGEFSADFAGSTTLAPGQSVDVDVTFSPTDATPKSATLEVDHDAPNTADPLTVALAGDGSSTVPVGFGVSGLDVNLGNPTSLDFGPDGRLYVSQQSGEIKAFEITRNGPNDYEVTDTETIDAVQDIPNHNDDGSYNSGETNRQVTGLIVEGTASTPVVYVSSSDPRIGAGGSHTDSGLDTNSGVVSRLTLQSDGSWDHDMLVRGLPRSEENHATNGLQYDAETNTLYVAQGGHTNKGAPSDNFALTPEYALSAAILSIDLDQIDSMSEKDAANTDATYLYDLPTLQGTATPFGGQDGENMALWTSDSPVDVYSPGFRNAYDIALNDEGQLYATDNSANPGWGGIVVDEGPQGVCTNEQNEQDEFSATGVYHIADEDYYGGHPNPTRGNPNSQFGGAVEAGLHDPVNCDYISPTNGTSESAALDTFGSTPQGMDVYTASNFGGEMKGDLLLAMWNSGSVERVQLNAQGTAATSSESIFQNIGSNPLDVHAQGDEGPFPGTVWAATYGSNAITVFEPNDYDGAVGPTCTADDTTSSDYDPDGDADGDGYTNADENAVGTDPCSQASQPADRDFDGSPDSLDDDDDNDGLSDGEDPFAIDPTNGLSNDLPVDRQFEAGQHPNSLFGLGFTGLMTNGQNYADLYDASKVRAGGATERISVDEVPFGDAYQNKNSQEYAFQYGVNATGDVPFTIVSTVESPFSDDMTPENYQAAGVQFGPGDQDNYIKLVAAAQDANGNPNGGVEFVKEVDGSAESTKLSESDVFGSGQTIDLYLDVYPSNDTVVASYAIDGGERVYFDDTYTVPDGWYADENRGLAVGLISTANGADETFSASWDRLSVTEIGANAAPVADAGANVTVEEGETVTLDATGSTDAEGDQLGYSWTQVDGPAAELSVQDGSQPTFTAPDVDGDATLTFEVTVTDENGGTDTDTVTVTVEDTDSAATGELVFAVNAGGPEYTAGDGTVYAADTNYDGGSDFTSGASGTSANPAIAGTEDDTLYQSERYGENFGYDVPVENGTYVVTLQFAEIYQGVSTNDAVDSDGPSDGTQENDRVFDVAVEGEPALTNYDIFAEVGPLAATEETYTVEVTDGELNVDFTAVNDNAKLSALTVESVGPQPAPTTSANVTVNAGDGNVAASTYNAGSFVVENTGEADISSVTIDLSESAIPDTVFDPAGTAGDTGGKCFVADAGASDVGLVTSGDGSGDDSCVAPFSNPHNGVDGADGYDTLTVEFDDFGPGETFAFSVDIDPTSIKDVSGTGGAGSVSGLELTGSSVTVVSSEATVQNDLFADGSDAGSQATVDADVPAAPSLGVEGVSLSATDFPAHDAATVSDAQQTVTVSGPAGATVELVHLEAGITTTTVDTGYDVDDFEANSVEAVDLQTVTLDANGEATVPVTLSEDNLHYFVAAVSDGATGRTSDAVVLDYDPSAVEPPEPSDAVYRVNAGGSAYTDAAGNEWSADDYFAGGTTTDVAADHGVTDVAGTEDDALYVTERYGQNGAPVNYTFPVEDGTYGVTLHFAEIWFGTEYGNTAGGDGSRVFSANLEGGDAELEDYDIHADVGALNATTKTYTVEVTDGELNVDFVPSVENAKVSAIEVHAVDDGPSNGEATIAIDEGEGLGATTWDAESFEVTNTGDEPISSLTLDLRSAVLPDVVFDPDGTAGDAGAKGFVLGANGTSGTVDATVTNPHNGVNGSDGYDTLTVEFGSFQPGESITFEIDNDPTSIKDGSSVQSGEAGPISGLELSGSTMTVEFEDGSTAETSLFGDGSDGGSQGVADATVAPAPAIDVQGVSLAQTTLSPDHTAATVSDASQTVVVDGQPGETVTLLHLEGELSLVGVPDFDGTPGYDIEDYEANSAVQVTEYTATVGSDGTVEIPVTLTDSAENAGLNYFVAVAHDDEDETGLTSNVVVLDYDQSADDGPGPVGDFADAPTDSDGDGVYEDVNGDGSFNVGDVQALYANLQDSAVQSNVDAFDVNGDESVNVGDVQALYAELVAGGN